ncbi:MAG: hypothetical protein JWQ96_574 [Segetibacter sp.]|nr:hypothetical protein [Segetibacter sp.]
MTWGNKLVFVFIAFAALMGTLVYKCMQQNFELVSKDYYNEELRYQDKIDGTNNANKLSNVKVDYSGDELHIHLPKELNGLALTGDALFYCATNSKFDRKLPLQVNDEGLMNVGLRILAKTNYILKISWQVGNEQYYNEQSVDLK